MTSPTATRDDRLAIALDALSKQQAAGTPIDWTIVGTQHPDLVDEIKQLLAVGQMIDFVRLSPTVTATPPAASAPTGLTPPCTFGAYDLLAEIGRGGMGVVYKAWDKKLNRSVAIKVSNGIVTNEESRFILETQVAGGLQHPHIVPVYQEGIQDGRLYYCMPYIAGKTLQAEMADKPLPARQAAQYLVTIARAVHYAHERQLLHRDLKPANILIDESKQPLVTDFGLAKHLTGVDGLTTTGVIVGTPSYMSPEQAEGANRVPLTPASDIYSLGAIFYEMLTGRPPFLAASAVATLLLVRTEEPVRPRALNPQIDVDLEFICRKCLEKNPEHRYASASQLADDLEAFLNGEPVAARSSSLVYFFSRILRETHHAPVLENWGLLWMCHSLQIFTLCAVTSAMYAYGIHDHWSYMTLWSICLVAWGIIFWNLRRRGGPVTFVERQIAHSWAAGVIASIGLFIVEIILERPVLELTPVLAVVAGMVFLVMAGTLAGWFYIAAGLCFLGVVPMAYLGPPWSPLLFGAVSAIGFFIPGLKYYRQRLRSLRE